MNQHPIGIFDSGVGGTSIWRELHKLLPSEDTIYLADSKNAPYGEKSGSEIINLSKKNVDWLLERDCKMIIVACNTATTNAIAYLRSHYPVPFIGIEPAIKPAALHSATGKVGVLATSGTLASQLFLTTSKTHAEDILILEQVGEGLVRLIEQGKIDSSEMRLLLQKYLEPMINAGIDQLVLG
ncbi:MAG: glutamate racemase, partial [Flavobacteriaceae bacterium]